MIRANDLDECRQTKRSETNKTQRTKGKRDPRVDDGWFSQKYDGQKHYSMTWIALAVQMQHAQCLYNRNCYVSFPWKCLVYSELAKPFGCYYRSDDTGCNCGVIS